MSKVHREHDMTPETSWRGLAACSGYASRSPSLLVVGRPEVHHRRDYHASSVLGSTFIPT